MLPIYVFALLIHAAFSSTVCRDGVEITSRNTNNPEDLIGNWSYVYHWDNINRFKQEFADEKEHKLQCPKITISAISPDYLKEKETECSGTQKPFKWSDARLRIDAPHVNIDGGILFIGEKENWLMSKCNRMVRFVARKVSDEYVVMVNPDIANTSDMIARKVPSLEELKCVAHNVDVGRGMSGVGLCN